MFTRPMVANEAAKQPGMVRAFGVLLITVKGGVKWYRERDPGGFFERVVGKRAGRVLPGEVLKAATALLQAGKSVPGVARERKVLPNTIPKAMRAQRLPALQETAG